MSIRILCILYFCQHSKKPTTHSLRPQVGERIFIVLLRWGWRRSSKSAYPAAIVPA